MMYILGANSQISPISIFSVITFKISMGNPSIKNLRKNQKFILLESWLTKPVPFVSKLKMLKNDVYLERQLAQVESETRSKSTTKSKVEGSVLFRNGVSFQVKSSVKTFKDELYNLFSKNTLTLQLAQFLTYADNLYIYTTVSTRVTRTARFQRCKIALFSIIKH